jgi:hypothetical protein
VYDPLLRYLEHIRRIWHASTPSGAPQTCLVRFHADWSVPDTTVTLCCCLRRLRRIWHASTLSRVPYTCLAGFYTIWSATGASPMCLAHFHAIWSGSDALSTLPHHVGGLGVCGVSPQAIFQGGLLRLSSPSSSLIRLDPKLTLWVQGIKTVPHRIRAKLASESILL